MPVLKKIGKTDYNVTKSYQYEICCKSKGWRMSFEQWITDLNIHRTHYPGRAYFLSPIFPSRDLMFDRCPLQSTLSTSAHPIEIFLYGLMFISQLHTGFLFLFPPHFLGLIASHPHHTHTCRKINYQGFTRGVLDTDWDGLSHQAALTVGWGRQCLCSFCSAGWPDFQVPLSPVLPLIFSWQLIMCNIWYNPWAQ